MAAPHTSPALRVLYQGTSSCRPCFSVASLGSTLNPRCPLSPHRTLPPTSPIPLHQLPHPGPIGSNYPEAPCSPTALPSPDLPLPLPCPPPHSRPSSSLPARSAAVVPHTISSHVCLVLCLSCSADLPWLPLGDMGKCKPGGGAGDYINPLLAACRLQGAHSYSIGCIPAQRPDNSPLQACGAARCMALH